jgi:type IV secretory pathway TraG/TraD family ATPase VirD4
LGNEEFGGPLVRLVVGNAINTRRRMWNRMSVPEGMPLHQCVGREFPKPLWIFVDEARSMGNCEAVVDAVNELRKARVNAFLTFHTLADVKETYSSPQALLNGCAWIINGGSRDLALYKEASALAGDTTVMSHSFSKGEKKSESEHEISRPVVKPDELQRLAPDESVVIAHGLIAKLKKPWRIQKGTVRYL